MENNVAAKEPITGDMLISEIISKHQDAIYLLMNCGMGCVSCPASQMESLTEAILQYAVIAHCHGRPHRRFVDVWCAKQTIFDDQYSKIQQREGIHRNVNLFTLLIFTKKNCNMVAISYDNC